MVLYDGRQQPVEWLGFADVVAEVVERFRYEQITTEDTDDLHGCRR